MSASKPSVSALIACFLYFCISTIADNNSECTDCDQFYTFSYCLYQESQCNECIPCYNQNNDDSYYYFNQNNSISQCSTSDICTECVDNCKSFFNFDKYNNRTINAYPIFSQFVTSMLTKESTISASNPTITLQCIDLSDILSLKYAIIHDPDNINANCTTNFLSQIQSKCDNKHECTYNTSNAIDSSNTNCNSVMIGAFCKPQNHRKFILIEDNTDNDEQAGNEENITLDEAILYVCIASIISLHLGCFCGIAVFTKREYLMRKLTICQTQTIPSEEEKKASANANAQSHAHAHANHGQNNYSSSITAQVIYQKNDQNHKQKSDPIIVNNGEIPRNVANNSGHIQAGMHPGLTTNDSRVIAYVNNIQNNVINNNTSQVHTVNNSYHNMASRVHGMGSHDRNLSMQVVANPNANRNTYQEPNVQYRAQSHGNNNNYQNGTHVQYDSYGNGVYVNNRTQNNRQNQNNGMHMGHGHHPNLTLTYESGGVNIPANEIDAHNQLLNLGVSEQRFVGGGRGAHYLDQSNEYNQGQFHGLYGTDAIQMTGANDELGMQLQTDQSPAQRQDPNDYGFLTNPQEYFANEQKQHSLHGISAINNANNDGQFSQYYYGQPLARPQLAHQLMHPQTYYPGGVGGVGGGGMGGMVYGNKFVSAEVNKFVNPIQNNDLEMDETKIQSINNQEIQFEAEIGSGTACKVFKARWRNVEVAAKKFMRNAVNVNKSQQYIDEFAKILLENPHPNVIRLMSYVAKPFTLLTEYMNGGSVRNYIDKKRSGSTSVSILDRIELCSQAAKGFEHLHKFDIIHRDINARNLLMNRVVKNNRISIRVVVSDYGLSNILNDDVYADSIKAFGPLKWMAPESIDSKHEFSKQSDVYSFGITLWEIITGQEPYPDIDPVDTAIHVVVKDRRPQSYAFIPESIQTLMKRCWHTERKERPPFKDIQEELSRFVNSEKIDCVSTRDDMI